MATDRDRKIAMPLARTLGWSLYYKGATSRY